MMTAASAIHPPTECTTVEPAKSTNPMECSQPSVPPPVPKLGHVSSSAYLSPTLGHPISLGLVEGGMSREGETVWAMFPLRDEAVEVRIVDPIFFDKEGERLHA